MSLGIGIVSPSSSCGDDNEEDDDLITHFS